MKVNNIKEKLRLNGYILMEFIDMKHIIVQDENGYKYRIIWSSFEQGKRPHLLSHNPFAADNIIRYLELNRPNLMWVDKPYVNCKVPIGLKCKNHLDKPIQYSTLDTIINDGCDCKYCSKQRVVKRIDTNIIIKRCQELNLEFVSRFVKNQETWVNFICNVHSNKGVQQISWYHLKTCGKGCPYCTGRYKTTQEFAEEIAEISPNITIIGEYRGSENPVRCQCNNCGHIWSPIGRSLKNGQGCPHCNISKGETSIKDFLNHHNILYYTQYTFDDCKSTEVLKYDFYLPDTNTCIEYDGEQHFFPVDFGGKGKEFAEEQFKANQMRDNIKNEYCKNKGIRLIRIPYFNAKSINDILTKELLS